MGRAPPAGWCPAGDTAAASPCRVTGWRPAFERDAHRGPEETNNIEVVVTVWRARQSAPRPVRPRLPDAWRRAPRRWHRRDETTKVLVPELTVSGRICCRRPRTPPRGSASPDASRRCRKEVCDEQGPRTGRKTGFFRTGWERPGINYLCSRCLDEHGRGTGPGRRWPATASSSDRSHRTPGRCQPRSRPARRRPRGNRRQGRLRHPVAAPQRPSSAGNPSSPGGSCAPSVFWNIANCV